MRAFNAEPAGGLTAGGDKPFDGGADPLDDPSRRRGDGGQVDMERVLRRQRRLSLSYADAPGELALERTRVPDALARHLRTPVPSPCPYQGDPELVVAADPFGEAAEVFRELRIQLAAKALERKTKVALAVVGPGRRDGKSYLAANLAASFGQLGGRTLLVDADLRSPRLHRLLGMEDLEGLSSILRGDGGHSLVQPVPQVPGLFFLPAGTVPPNPVELLQSPRLSLLVFEMLLAFDHVVVDTPADACGPDARLVAATAGAALVVGRKDCSTMDDLRTLLAKLGQQQVEVAGMVMNQHRS
ncbi:MAG TPA: CpsD/CapB family tyrosine-protein kinase [Ramlibacter sp.]|jgi:capsular exopolysaccharide synthesis family protein|uniref:CpsD/CapB family tyrosine-protein kinase n=1 Tax=Ramlibacter sp. TaxID=1917967 RepID=UPI002D62DF6A|nr:CpsD/CapB family tyrosine-protein kinase [Ramlibacter sp.]HZY18402.1 CpsD/CapB family tyrosine-protein kinase [Ramlibacter sp.]